MATELLIRNLDADGHEILNVATPTQAGSATHTDNSSTPSTVGGTATPGSSFLAAPADHTHVGVSGVSVGGGAVAHGDVNFVAGTNVTIARVGQDITINAGVASKVTLSNDGAGYMVGTTEDVIREWLVNFDDVNTGSIKAMLAGIVKITNGASTATYNLRVGATTPGSITGSTVRATFTSTSLTEEVKEVLGTAFTNPGGRLLVQVSAVSNTAGARAVIRGITVSFG